MTLPETSEGPAGPDRLQRFNSVRLLIASIALIVISIVYLVNALSSGRSWGLPAALLAGGAVGLVFGVRMVRRHWVRHNGVTLDEADPHRTPEQQRRRDDRVRRNQADMTPRQEIAVGLGLIPFALLAGALPLLFGDTIGPPEILLTGALTVLGLVLLVRGLVRRGRAG